VPPRAAPAETDFKKLYAAFKADTAFELHPAVRKPEGGCVDEDNCDYEKVTLCSFNQTAVTDTKVDFLVCMDEVKGKKPALMAARPCAEQVSIDFSKVTACYNGDMGTTLLEEASKVFNAALPGRTTIPHTFVNQEDTQPEYSALKSQLCKDGSTAAACSEAAPREEATCEI